MNEAEMLKKDLPHVEMEGSAPYLARICRCGLIESKIAWAAGGRGCPVCKRHWPENLCEWNMRGLDPATPYTWTPPRHNGHGPADVAADGGVYPVPSAPDTPNAAGLFAVINRLRDQLAVAQMKNALISDVLRAADQDVALYEDPTVLPRPTTGPFDSNFDREMRAVRAWRKAGRPGLIDE